MFLKKAHKITEFVYVLLLVSFMVVLVLFPERYVRTTFDGIKIWAVTVLPSLLPFFFLTALLTKTRAIGGLCGALGGVSRVLYNESGLAVYLQIMSFLSGYPIGAKLICELYKSGAVSEAQAKKLSVTSSTSGPLFIVGGVGIGMFADKKIGLILLISHYLSSIVVGIIFRGIKTDGRQTPLKAGGGVENALYESVYSSVISVAIVGGFIAVFYTLANVLLDFYVLSPVTFCLEKFLSKQIAEGVAIGLIECTTGIKAVACSGANPLSVAISCALITLGGAAVWCQSIIYLSRAKVRVGFFIAAKVIQAAVAFGLCLLLCVLFK